MKSLFRIDPIVAGRELTEHIAEATAYFDGCCIPNPGAMGAGVVLNLRSSIFKQNLVEEAVPLGNGTNNLAEWMALYVALRLLSAHGVKTAVIYGDSQLVINQVLGVWRVKDATIAFLHGMCHNVLRDFVAVSFNWIPRHLNEKADALSTKGARNNV